MPIVKMPDGTQVNFPDDMPHEQIKGLIASKFPDVVEQQPPVEQGQPEPSFAESAFQGAKQGATFGFGDELQSALAAGTVGATGLLGGETGGLTPAETYKQSMADYKAQREAAKAAHPVAYIGGEALSSIPTGMTAATRLGGAKLATVLRTSPKLATVGLGGISGATYGFGTGEGDVTERLKSAGTSGLYGVAGGAIGSQIGRLAGKGIKKLSPAATTSAESLAGKSLADIGVETGKDVVAQAPMGADAKAFDKIVKAVKKDFPDNWQEVLQTWKSGDVPLAELYSSRVTDLAKGAAQYPSGKKLAGEYFGQKVLETPERLKKAVEQNISSFENYYKTADDLLRAGQAKAAPKYEAALKVNVGADTRLNQFLATPEMQDALKKGLELQRIEAVAKGKPFNPTDYAVTAFNEAGDPIISGVPNMRSFDAVKRGLDNMIDAEKNSITGKLSDKGRVLYGLRNSMVERLDQLNPIYKEARQTAGDYFKIDEAIRGGKDFFKQDPELLQKSLKSMSESEKTAFKIGVGKQIRDTIDKTIEGANPYNRIFGTPEKKKKLGMILAPKEFMNLERSLKAEDKLFKMRNEVLGGSPTTSKAIAAAEMTVDGAEMLANLASAGIKGTAISAVRTGIKKAFDGLSDNTANAVSRLIYETDPIKKAALLERTLGDKSINAAEREAIKRYYFVANDFMKERTAGAIGGAVAAQEGNK